MSHQRGGTAANKRINDFLLSEYRQPKDFRSFTYMSQLLQADAMKMAMEAHRRICPIVWDRWYGSIMTAGRWHPGLVATITDVGRRSIILQ